MRDTEKFNEVAALQDPDHLRNPDLIEFLADEVELEGGVWACKGAEALREYARQLRAVDDPNAQRAESLLKRMDAGLA